MLSDMRMMPWLVLSVSVSMWGVASCASSDAPNSVSPLNDDESDVQWTTLTPSPLRESPDIDPERMALYELAYGLTQQELYRVRFEHGEIRQGMSQARRYLVQDRGVSLSDADGVLVDLNFTCTQVNESNDTDDLSVFCSTAIAGKDPSELRKELEAEFYFLPDGADDADDADDAMG